VVHKNKFNKLPDLDHTARKERIGHTIAEVKLMVKIIRELAESLKESADNLTQNIDDMARSVDEHIKELQQEIDRNNNAKTKGK